MTFYTLLSSIALVNKFILVGLVNLIVVSLLFRQLFAQCCQSCLVLVHARLHHDESLVELSCFAEVPLVCDFVDLRETSYSLNVVLVVLDRLLKVLDCVFVVFNVAESTRKVEHALRGVGVVLQRLQVSLDRSFEAVYHVKSVAQIVKGLRVTRVQVESQRVSTDSLLILGLRTVSVSEVVIGFRFVGILLN